MADPGTTLPIWRCEGPILLSGGAFLPEIDIAYETWGPPPQEAERVVVVLHALSGSSHAFSSPSRPERGWWEGLLENDSPISPESCHLICANIVGGCYGTTGPSSIDPRTGERYGTRFPQITLLDMVQAQRRLLAGLGIERPITVIGGSMGGMLALLWAREFPEQVDHVVAIAAPATSDAFTIGVRHVQREAIVRDPNWQDGNYDEDSSPKSGLALARELGMLTYRSPLEFAQRFGRQQRDERLHFREGLFEVQSYLRYQGQKFVTRFDANTYLYFSRAMDLFDLADGYSSLPSALQPIRARTLLLPIDSDFLCPIKQIQPIAEAMLRNHQDVALRLLTSSHGHDGFLIETEQIVNAIRVFYGR